MSENVTEERPWYKKKRYIIPGALLVIGGISGAFSEEEQAPAETTVASSDSSDAAAAEEVEAEAAPAKTEKAEKPKAKPKAKAVKVNAGDMIKAFEDNELAADDKYKGKTIQVSGTVDKIDTEVFDSSKYVLRISDGSEFAFLTVNCNDMSKKELSTLNTGDDVTAVGKFKDGGDLGVELKKCKLA